MRVCKSPMRRRAGSNCLQRCEGVMDSSWSMPQDPVFWLCLFVGTFVVFMFCMDQFAKPSVSVEDHDPWSFVATRNLTPWHQYLVGFSVYCGSLLLVFLAV